VLTQACITIGKRNRHGGRSRCNRCWWLLPLFGIVFTGCDFPGRTNARQRAEPADLSLNFDVLYAHNCSGCHGPGGRLGPAPPLNDPLFLTIVPDNVLESAIREGRRGTLMPAFAEDKGGTLSAAQVQVLAGGLKTHWRPSKPPGGELPPYLVAAKANPEDATGAVQRGAAAFARACAGCHGAKGEGDSAGAIADPAFLALISDQTLRRLIITGRPDLDMPNYAQTDGRTDDFRPLTSAEINDLVAFIRRVGKVAPATARHDRSVRPALIAPIAAATRGTSN
jgi:cytochrome c oxidase cbb3-type subunit 3